MNFKAERVHIAIAGGIIGIISVALVLLGNPANMGFCLACFIRDTAGGLGLHRAEAVQYIRPEVIGLVLGAMILSLVRGEFSPRGGSSPITRFIISFFVMVGALMFLGCPFRMVLRLAGGDLNAVVGLVGFVVGILAGIFFLKNGYSLKRTYKQTKIEGFGLPIIQLTFLFLLLAAPAFIFFTKEGPGAKHAAVLYSLGAGLLVGALAQYTRLCMVGGFRDMILFREPKLLIGFCMIFLTALIGNVLFGKFHLGFTDQPIAHADSLWNFLGMVLAGLGCTLLGGCPLRQMVMAGEGNADSAVCYLGLLVGAAFCHNFNLASSGKGPTPNGKIAVLVGLLVLLCIACLNTFGKKESLGTERS